MKRHPQAIDPAPGQESVWDYPRPPRLEPCDALLKVMFADRTIAETRHGWRVLETSHPPVYYLPPTDIDQSLLVAAAGASFCEFKGAATYWSIRAGDRVAERAGWSYRTPTAQFAKLADYVAFYASKVDACWVGDEQVAAQEGDFYGGWITSRVVGPFKGAPGTRFW